MKSSPTHEARRAPTAPSRRFVASSGLCLPLLFSLTTACGEPLKFPQDLEETRVLGVQIQTPDGRSWPGPEEEASVHLLVAGPEGPQQVRAAYSACFAVSSLSGVPQCDTPILGEGVTGPSTVPSFTFVGAGDVDEEQRLSILGVVCESGEPRLAADPVDWGCSDASHPLRFSLETVGKNLDNSVPVLSDTVVFYDGEEALAESVSDRATCTDAPNIPLEETASLVIELDPRVLDPKGEETLQISHFSTAGRYERQYSIVELGEPLQLEIDFEAPDEPGPIKNYLVVRDERGGTSWWAWSSCAVEP